jgi:hypothetical protein
LETRPDAAKKHIKERLTNPTFLQMRHLSLRISVADAVSLEIIPVILEIFTIVLRGRTKQLLSSA